MNLNLFDLKLKPLYDTKEKKYCKISSIVDYARSLQYKIYIVYGYGVNEVTAEEFIMKKDVDSFCKRFQDPVKVKIQKEVENMKKEEEMNLVKMSPKEVLEQGTKYEGSTNFEKMQNILLNTLEGLQTGKVKPEQAKSIANVAQTLINSVKIEAELNRGRGDKSKPKFLM